MRNSVVEVMCLLTELGHVYPVLQQFQIWVNLYDKSITKSYLVELLKTVDAPFPDRFIHLVMDILLDMSELLRGSSELYKAVLTFSERVAEQTSDPLVTQKLSKLLASTK